MALGTITSVELTYTKNGSWQTVDISSYVPVGTEVAILHIETTGAAGEYAFRHPDSTDDRYPNSAYIGHRWLAVGLKDRKFEVKSDAILVALTGYIKDGVTWKVNAPTKNLSTTETWTELDLSTECPGAKLIMVEVSQSGVEDKEIGFRKHGSTDNRHNTTRKTHTAFVPCDGSQHIDYYTEVEKTLYILGYITEHITTRTNAYQCSAGTGDWVLEDLNGVASAGSGVAILEIDDATLIQFGIRPTNASGYKDTEYNYPYYHTWGVVGLDEDLKFHKKETNAKQGLFVLAYAIPVLEAKFSAIPVSGDVPFEVQFTDETVGGETPYTYTWDFGDGSPVSHLQNPAHTYGVEGFYTVKLTVTDSSDPVQEDLEEKTNYILAKPPEVAVEIERVDKSPSAGSYQDVDVSGDISQGLTGVLLHIHNSGSSEYEWAVRKNGSTDDIKSNIAAGAHAWAMIGVDGSKIFEAYISHADIKIWLEGYTRLGIEFLDNKVDKTPATGWQTVDCSGDVGGAEALALIFMVENTTADALRPYGIRMNGSTDSHSLGNAGFVNQAGGEVHFLMIGCDVDQKIQFTHAIADDTKLYLIGYVWSGMEFSANATDKSLGVYESYQNVDCSAISATAAWVMVQVNCKDKAARSAALRHPSSSVDEYNPVTYGGWKLQHMTASQIFEAKVEDADVDFWVVGWVKETVLTQLNIYGTVKVGLARVEDAIVTCFSLSKGEFVGMVKTDAEGQYIFTSAGYEFELFLISAHYDDGVNRWGLCKKLQLEDE